MNKPNNLSGHDLVAKGITKIQATLPELGLKDVHPTGSWLEEKQIQSAIEARKQLIEAERIEKSGILSHAEWKENLNLAEVTQRAGGYWQYMGHNVGKKLFLYPEEALFLMEVNCLLLKYNDVKVSLQQAYSLLLRDKTCRIQFKVYASLSRIGYKVLRHKDILLDNISDSGHIEKLCSNAETVRAASKNSVSDYKKDINEMDEIQIESNVIKNHLDDQQDKDITRETQLADGKECEENTDDAFTSGNSKQQYVTSIYQNQIEKLKKRLYKTSDAKNLQKSFKNLSNLLHNQLVSIKVPETALIPDNISFNKSEYTINLQSIKNKCLRPSLTDSRTYSVTDEVNGDHVRRVVSAINSRRNRNGANFHVFNTRIQTNQLHFRPFNFWQPFIRTNYFQFGISLQRPFMANMYTTPRFQYSPGFQNIHRPTFNNYIRGDRDNATHSQKRSRDRLTKIYHYESLKRLAARLKNLFLSGNMQPMNLEELNKLIQTYNTRYKSRLKLSDEFEIVDDSILETIILHDDEEVRSKRPRLDDHYETYTSNLNSIKEMANRLKILETNDRATTRHRRAFSNLIKTFNKCHKADIYITSNFEVFDKSHITLDSSSSDSDCVVDESTKGPGSKKLRNPFNILKRLSEKSNKSIDEPGTSREYKPGVDKDSVRSNSYSDIILKNFGKDWLPDENDFGRPEIVSADTLNNVTRPGNFIYEFMKYHPQNFESWLDLKIAFLRSLEETTEVFRKDTDSCHKSLITPEDCTDIATVLDKLSVIKPANCATETNMVVDYDVYNRDVKNFRKTNRPVPHFRVLSLDESSHFPSGQEIAALHAKYEDSICIVFAIVGDGSISYVQIKPTSLPMHISSHNTT